MDLYAVRLYMDLVDLLIVVALEGHLGMDCFLVVAEPSLIPLQQDVGHPKVELIGGIVPVKVKVRK